MAPRAEVRSVAAIEQGGARERGRAFPAPWISAASAMFAPAESPASAMQPGPRWKPSAPPANGVERGGDVVEGRRERVLGGEAVVDGENGRSASTRQKAHGPVVRVRGAERPAAAVDVDHERLGLAEGRTIETSRNGAAGRLEDHVPYLRELGLGSFQGRAFAAKAARPSPIGRFG